MAVSLLSCRNAGSTGYPTVYRVVGCQNIQFGETFATQLVTGASGTFTPGETLTMDGGHTAVLTQDMGSGVLIINQMSAGWGSGSGTITGGTSTETATVSTFEGLEPSGGSNHDGHNARVIQFRNRVYCIQGNTIYRINETTNFWESVYRFAVPVAVANTAYKTGLYTLQIGGVTHMVALYYSVPASSTIRRLKSSNGTAWSEAQVSTGIFAANYALDVTIWKNILYVISGSSSIVGVGSLGHLSWNPETDTTTFASWGSFINNTSLCNRQVVWRNRLFTGGVSTFTGRWILMEFANGAYTTVTDGGVSINAGAGVEPFKSSSIGFVGPDDNLYFITPADLGSSYGYKCYKVTLSGGNFTTTDISTTVLPASLRTNANFDTRDDRLRRYVDNEANAQVGGPVNVYWWHAANPVSATRTLYYWEGDSTVSSQIDDGGDESVALPGTVNGGGERTYFPTSLGVEILGVIPIDGGWRITFIIDYWTEGSPISDVSFKLVYGNKGSAGVAIGTLSNPSVGTVVGGNTLTGLTADGTTEYQVDWLGISSDSQANGAFEQNYPVVFTE